MLYIGWPKPLMVNIFVINYYITMKPHTRIIYDVLNLSWTVQLYISYTFFLQPGNLKQMLTNAMAVQNAESGN